MIVIRSQVIKRRVWGGQNCCEKQEIQCTNLFTHKMATFGAEYAHILNLILDTKIHWMAYFQGFPISTILSINSQ